MTVSLKHAFQSAKPDGADTSIVRPSDWNAEHVLTQATNKLLGRTSAGTGATEEIAAGSGLTLGSGTLSADVTSVAGRTGAVTLSVTDVSGAAPAASPTFTGKSSFPASTSTGANVNLGYGANVTSNLVDGDIWIETNNLRWYSNGVTWRASAVGHTHVSTAITDSTAAGRALLTGADASAQRTSLGLGSAALLNTSVIVQQDSATGSAYLPAGTTAQRPGTPAAGYIRYNSTTGKFEGFGSSWGNIGGGAAIGDTPPANPGAGDLWWNSADGRMYVYYTDANSSQWVDLSAGGAGQYLPLTGGSVTGNVAVTGETSTGSLKVNNVPILAGPAFAAYATTLTNTATATWTKVVMITEEFDTDNCYNTGTSRFQPTVAGYYQVNGSVYAGYAFQTVALFKNGAEFKRGAMNNSAANILQTTVSSVVYLNGTSDYVELYWYQASGATYNNVAGQSITYFNGYLARAA